MRASSKGGSPALFTLRMSGRAASEGRFQIGRTRATRAEVAAKPFPSCLEIKFAFTLMERNGFDKK